MNGSQIALVLLCLTTTFLPAVAACAEPCHYQVVIPEDPSKIYLSCRPQIHETLAFQTQTPIASLIA